ncbi:MAG: DUF1298 domain-containing protein [Mycobacterium sp.]
MPGQPMSAVDAKFYWMSAAVPSDQFLLYAFDGISDDVDAVLAELRARAALCHDFTIRVQDSSRFRYPRWVSAGVNSSMQRHQLHDSSWQGCLNAIAALADRQLDCGIRPWRMHVFAPVNGAPACAGPSTVAVLQVAHALADGTRAAALAAWLFGRPGAPPSPPLTVRGRWVGRAWTAARTQKRLTADTEAGRLPPAGRSWAHLQTNNRPEGVRSVRTLVRRRDELRGPSVTVAVLAATGVALRRQLGVDGVDIGAEVPMAKSGQPSARNHFRSVGVGLRPALSWAERTQAIADDLTARRLRGEHPAAVAADEANASVPAGLLRWGVSKFDPDVRWPTVGGNTVVSSVNRGRSDLRFGSAPVVLTAGYPALSPMMGLVHGVHGIGKNVAISVHAAESAVGDVDAYVSLLGRALDDSL